MPRRTGTRRPGATSASGSPRSARARQLQAAERPSSATRRRANRAPRRSPPPTKAHDDEHQPEQDAQLDQRERLPRRLGASSIRARRCVRGAECGIAAGRGRPEAPRDRSGVRLRLRRPTTGPGCQAANGQPEESLTCHQPASIPMRPSRGRTCQTPQPPSPRSALAIAHELVAARLEQHPLQQRALAPPGSASRARARRARPASGRPARRAGPRARRATSRRGPPAPGRRASRRRAACGKAVDERLGELRSSAAICSRSDGGRARAGRGRRRARAGRAARDRTWRPTMARASLPRRPGRHQRTGRSTAPPRRKIAGTPGDLHGVDEHPAAVRALRDHAVAAARSRRRGVGDDAARRQSRRPPSRPGARPRRADAQRPGRRASASSAHTARRSPPARSAARRRAGSSRLKPPLHQALDRGRLDRRARRRRGRARRGGRTRGRRTGSARWRIATAWAPRKRSDS